jgi:hypothetical protein
MNFEPPANSVVYELLPPHSRMPAISAPFVAGSTFANGLEWPSWSWHGQSIRDQLNYVEVSRAPACYGKLIAASGGSQSGWWWQRDPVIFCHQCISPAGNVRLVVVGIQYLDLSRPWQKLGPFQRFIATANPAGCWQNHGYARKESHCGISPLDFAVRIYAGQSDPADPSHFSIGYEAADGRKFRVDGHLRDDDFISFTTSPPSTRLPPTTMPKIKIPM